jgi:hypothetical protein
VEKQFMGETIGNSVPWFDSDELENSTTSETTPGDNRQTPWVVVGVNLAPAEAAIIKGRLESQKIPAIVQQEAMGTVLGLTVGPLGSAKILVPEPLAERALAILSETFEADEVEEESWDETESD